MRDRYAQVVNAPVLSTLVRQLGLPQPVELDRYQPGGPVVAGPVLSGEAPGGRLARPVRAILDAIGAERAGTEGKATYNMFPVPVDAGSIKKTDSPPAYAISPYGVASVCTNPN